MRGEKRNFGTGAGAANPVRSGKPSHPGHTEIHDDQVGIERAGVLSCFSAVLRPPQISISDSDLSSVRAALTRDVVIVHDGSKLLVFCNKFSD